MSGVELAACPFCGGPEHHRFNSPDEFGRPSHGVQCANGDCWIVGPQRETAEEAQTAWNRRAVPMEAVAWRWVPTLKGKKEPWMVGDATPWVYWTGAARPDFSACPAGDIQDIQALALIPQAEDQETVK